MPNGQGSARYVVTKPRASWWWSLPVSGFCCWRCATLIRKPRDTLVAMLRLLLTHVARERELIGTAIDGRWPEPRQRPVHKGNKFGKIEDHEECLGLEMRVRSVLLWSLRSGTTEAEGA